MLASHYTLNIVLDLWKKSQMGGNNNPNQEKSLDIALRLYVLPQILGNVERIKKSEFATYADSITIDKLKNLISIFDLTFEKAVEEGKTSKSTGKNYRSALKQLSIWLEQQPWWKIVLSSEAVKFTPKKEKIAPRAKQKQKTSPRVSLKKDELPITVQQELEKFREFRLAGGLNCSRNLSQSKLGKESSFVRRPKLDPVKDSTIGLEENKILYFLGWYCQNFPEKELHLTLLTDSNLLDQFICWAMDNMNATYHTGIAFSNVAIALAKWSNYHLTARRNWSDIPLICELRSLKSEYAEEYEEEYKVIGPEKWEKKELSHQQLREVVDYLRDNCAEHKERNTLRKGKYKCVDKRHLSTIVRAWQTHLLVKILVYCPIRGEEITNWVFNDSLVRKIDEDGRAYYIVILKEHKRDANGKPRHYPLPSILTDDLDAWLFTWRPLIAESLESLEKWKKFSGLSSDVIERFQVKIDNAKRGIFHEKTSNSVEDYISYQENALARIQKRLDYLPLAKEQFHSYNTVFFSLAKKDIKTFGKPLEPGSFYAIVSRAVANATQVLFGETKWLNPHAFRHIAEKHLRLVGKTHLAEAFGALIGHSKDMGDEYASQIFSEYEITQDIVNNWWVNNFD